MEVNEVLKWDGLAAPLRRPVMVVALTGWFDAEIFSIRSIARGEQAANQMPPSEANDFCGAK